MNIVLSLKVLRLLHYYLTEKFNMGKYAFRCIVPGCKYHFLVEGESTEEAVNKIMIEGETHNFENHPEMPILGQDRVRKMIQKGIKKIV